MRTLNLMAMAALASALTAACEGCSLERSGIAPPVCDDPEDLRIWDGRDGGPPLWWLMECPWYGDGAVPEDAMVDAGSDAGADAALEDAGDAAIEMMDAGPDAAVGDAGSDAGPPDGGPPDGGPPDAGRDAGTDAGPSPIGCGDGTVDQAYPSADMVGCNGSGNQCDAESLCGAGWHLCSYSEYAARGGATVIATAYRWIASCVRRADCTAEAAPTDGICGSCSRVGGSARSWGTACGGDPPLTDSDCPLGVLANSAAGGGGYRLLSEATCTRTTVSATNGLYGATCCR